MKNIVSFKLNHTVERGVVAWSGKGEGRLQEFMLKKKKRRHQPQWFSSRSKAEMQSWCKAPTTMSHLSIREAPSLHPLLFPSIHCPFFPLMHLHSASHDSFSSTEKWAHWEAVVSSAITSENMFMLCRRAGLYLCKENYV